MVLPESIISRSVVPGEQKLTCHPLGGTLRVTEISESFGRIVYVFVQMFVCVFNNNINCMWSDIYGFWKILSAIRVAYEFRRKLGAIMFSGCWPHKAYI